MAATGSTSSGDRRSLRGRRFGEQLGRIARVGLALMGYLLGVMVVLYLLAFVFFLVAS